MFDVRFDTEALSGVRFGVSPLFETTISIRALHNHPDTPVHLPWFEQARRLTADLDLEPVRLLLRPRVYAPDFLNPPPAGPTAELESELAVMTATPARQIRAEVERCYADTNLPDVLRPFVDHPRKAINALAELLRAYWELAIEPHWPRISALLEHDILYRAQQLTDGGTRALFDELDPSVRWEGEVLRIDKDCYNSTIELDERGLLLLPSAFSWPKVLIVADRPWQPTLIYPARGVGMLWESERPATPDALAKLLGANRAAILSALDHPRSTTDLARVLEISAGGVSQHLSVLHSAGLVSRRRAQRLVLYLRSESGDALMQTAVAG
jgi:DNA-binding transcriptional ArsR family regulator